MCFDCWASEWGLMAVVIAQCGEWRHLDAALFLLCQGFTQQEAADVIGVRRSAVCHWVRHLRRRPEDVPEWLLRVRAGRGVTEDGQFVSGATRRG